MIKTLSDLIHVSVYIIWNIDVWLDCFNQINLHVHDYVHTRPDKFRMVHKFDHSLSL